MSQTRRSDAPAGRPHLTAIEGGAGRPMSPVTRLSPLVDGWIGSAAFLALFKQAQRRHLPRGSQVMLNSGDRRVAYLVSGVAALRRGKGQLVDFLHGGDFFNEAPLFGQSAEADAFFDAHTDCLVLQLEMSAFRTLAMEHPDLWVQLARQLSSRLALNYSRRGELWSDPIVDRIWKVLTRLAGRWEGPTERGYRSLHLSRDDLGSLAGCSRKHAGLAVQQLACEGRIITVGHRILIAMDETTIG